MQKLEDCWGAPLPADESELAARFAGQTPALRCDGVLAMLEQCAGEMLPRSTHRTHAG